MLVISELDYREGHIYCVQQKKLVQIGNDMNVKNFDRIKLKLNILLNSLFKKTHKYSTYST